MNLSRSRNVAILNKSDWQRITNRLNNYNPELEKFKAQMADREHLGQLSKDRVKQWDNTIEGQRLKKLQARKIKQAQEEVERQKMDLEEAKYQAQVRKETIQKAKRLQYMQTDRVKGFHSALTVTEVLKEREAQVLMKKGKQNWEKENEMQMVEQQKEYLSQMLKEEQTENENKFKKAVEHASFQRLQVNERKQGNEKEIQEDIEEGRSIKEQCESHKKIMDGMKKKAREYKVTLRDGYLNEIDLKKQRLEEERLNEVGVEKEIKKFVTAKRKMALFRKEKENELFQSFQNHTAKIREQLHVDLMGRIDDEDARIAKAVQEQDSKREKEAETKRQAEIEAIQLMHEQRVRMINDHKVARKEDMLKDKAFLQQNMKDDLNFKLEVENNKMKKRTCAKKVQDFYNKQIQENKDIAESEKKKALEMHAKNTEFIIEDENLFQEYANQVIEDAKVAERNLFPLIKARNEGPGGGRGPIFEGKAGLRPSYIVNDKTGVQLPHYHREDSIKTRVYGHVGKTENRLGFNWKNQFV